jgi:hypothetical protein
MIINASHLVSVLNTYYACPFSYLIAFPVTDFTDYHKLFSDYLKT